MQKITDKFIRIPEVVHRKCKAAAALRGLELKEWVGETLATSAQAEISAYSLLNDSEVVSLEDRSAYKPDMLSEIKREPTCVEK